MPSKLNRERALFVLGKIDESFASEQRKESERDTKFVELGRYLSKEDFPSREEKPTISCRSMKAFAAVPTTTERSWIDGGSRTSESGTAGWPEVQLCNLVAQGSRNEEGSVREGSRKGTDRGRQGTVGDRLLQIL